MTAGQRPPSSPRGFSGFCFALSKRLKDSRVQLRPIRGNKESVVKDTLYSRCLLQIAERICFKSPNKLVTNNRKLHHFVLLCK